MTGPVVAPFVAAALSAPQQPALEDADGLVTRGELLGRTAGLAERVQRHDAYNRLVGVLLPRDRQLAAAILAIHLAGAAYLPLDPNQPDARLHAMVADARPVCVLTSGPLRHRVPVGVPVVVHEEVPPAAGAPPRHHPAGRVAYLMYTSGSSGAPKGVLVGQAALGNFFSVLDSVLATPRQQVWQAVSSVGFDSSVAEILWPLARGKYLCLTPNDPLSLLDSALARGTVTGTCVTHVQGTPSVARLLAGDPSTLAGLRRLDTLLVGGEPFPGDLQAVLTAGEGTGPRMINVYGPTESTVWVACAEIHPAMDEPYPIGPAIAGARLYVLDDQLRPARTGRLYIGGAPLSLGYWRLPALTAGSFLPDPFAGGGARMYDSGDLAGVGRDGQIAVFGRADAQVKIRGHRVELGEIEAVLQSCPWVRGAVCVYDREPGGHGVLTAIAVAEQQRAEQVRQWVAQRLPPYMVPKRFVFRLEALPLSPSGKVDRAALRRSLNSTGQARPPTADGRSSR
jgi:amino acid adenylation domain-containing protein